MSTSQNFKKLLIAAMGTSMLFLAVPAMAQQGTGKKNPQCVPDFIDRCLKRCAATGGQLAKCPRYCDDRRRDLGCLQN